MEEWYMQYLRDAYRHALISPDTSTQNGAIVLDRNNYILGWGANEFTNGMDVTPDLLERPKKYTFIEHAERNAIYHSLRRLNHDPAYGTPHTMVAAWASCADCARAIVQSGIKTLIRHDRSGVDRWSESIEAGDIILAAGDVTVIDVKGKIGRCDPVLVNGELWNP